MVDDLDRLRTDRRAFAAAIRLPLTDWQDDALALVKRMTVIAAPRQSGKSRSLVVLGLHRAFTEPDHRVLLVSASEDAARRLLGEAVAITTRSSFAGGERG
jgi:hypothetical protein